MSIRTGHSDETPGLQLFGEDDENLKVGHLGRDGAKPLNIRFGEQGGSQLLGRGRSLGSRLPGPDTREFLRGGVNFSLFGFWFTTPDRFTDNPHAILGFVEP